MLKTCTDNSVCLLSIYFFPTLLKAVRGEHICKYLVTPSQKYFPKLASICWCLKLVLLDCSNSLLVYLFHPLHCLLVILLNESYLMDFEVPGTGLKISGNLVCESIRSLGPFAGGAKFPSFFFLSLLLHLHLDKDEGFVAGGRGRILYA